MKDKMQYRTMPGSEEPLSVLGYGCMRLPTKVGGVSSSMIDKDRAVAQIRGAIDQGLNYIDTAWPYHLGASESFLGSHVLTDGYREKVNIATKLPCYLVRDKAMMYEFFEKQLEKLQVECIDYYLLHTLDGGSWKKMLELGVKSFMDDIKASGRVRHMGFSFHGRKEDFMTICDAYDFDFAQVQYNILDEHYQAGIEGIDYAASKGMGVIVMEPLRGGSLVGRMPEDVKKIYEASPYKRSSAEWALRWVWNNPNVTLLLSGMNEEAHIEENIRVACEALPDAMNEEEQVTIHQVRDTYNQLLQIGCTGCAYCMPCPAGIDIPSTFKELNNYHLFGKMQAKIHHGLFSGARTFDGKPHWTTDCIDCGKCEKACPQHLPIRATFPQVQKEIEGPISKLVGLGARAFLGRYK